MAINTDSKYTNIEALKALTSGKPEVWNKFAAEHEGKNKKIDISGVSLKGLNLDGFTIKNVNLEEANLQGATIKNTTFEDVYLTEANLKGSTVEDTNFRNSHLGGTSFKDATIKRVHFDDVVAPNVIFKGADLKEVTASGRMDSANFKKTTMADNTFHHVVFGGDYVSSSDGNGEIHSSKSGSDFTGAKLKNVKFNWAKFEVTTFHKSVLENVDFSGAELMGTKFKEASISGGSKFNRASLRGAVFSPDKVSPDTDFLDSTWLNEKMEKTINDRKLGEFERSSKSLNPPSAIKKVAAIIKKLVPPTKISDNDNREIAGKPEVAKAREK